MQRVSIIQRVLTNYRVSFFESLHEKLKEVDIGLQLLYGQGNQIDQCRGYLADISWAVCKKERYIQCGKYSLVYQPYFEDIKHSDLIIVGHEIKYILNHILLMKKKNLRYRLAFWGHIMNYQEDATSLMNRLKRKLNLLPDWWFTYTEEEAHFIAKDGFNKNNISVVQNTIDSKALLNQKGQISKVQLQDVRESLGINKNGPVGLFCGGMYAEKRLELVINACLKIKAELPDFHMIFIGAGPDARYVEDFAKDKSWVHYVGPVFDEKEKGCLFLISDVLLSPGLVGLGIIDSFALECPMITTSYPYHSPEIQYLKDGYNGLITQNDEEHYARTVIEILKDRSRLELLKDGCRQSIEKYSMENMVNNFYNGITQCLKHGGVRVG